jgi:hypothetical protein
MSVDCLTGHSWPLVTWQVPCPVRLLPVAHWAGTRAACEDWPRLHPLEGRQNMGKSRTDKLDNRAVRDLLRAGWSEEGILRVFLQVRERQILRLIDHHS